MKNSRMSFDVTVIICTRNRAQYLDRTLTDLQQQETTEEIEVIVVDNGSIDETEKVLAKPRPGLCLIPLFERTPGKSRALNAALAHVHGELILFTDDDVFIGPHWIPEIQRAAGTYPEATIFCGPIYPDFPPETPDWLRTHPFNGGFFGRFDKPFPEGYLPDYVLPFGANFAVRQRLIENASFRLDLGPSLENGALLGEDVEFVHRLREANNGCIYIPTASVWHRVRSEQLSSQWLDRRAFDIGRSEMSRTQYPHLLPELAARHAGSQGEPSYVERSCLIHYYCGQLAVCPKTGEEARTAIKDALNQLGLDSYADVLTPEARAACQL